MPEPSHQLVQLLRLLGRLVLTATVLNPFVAHADGLATQVLHGLAQVRAGRASFHEERHIAALTTVLKASGVVSFTREPDRLEKITNAPRSERLTIEGTTLTIVGADGRPHGMDIDERPGLREFVETLRAPLTGDEAALRESYNIAAEGDLTAWRLTLQPRMPMLARFVRRVTVKGTNNAVREIDIVQPNGDSQAMTLDPLP